LQADPDEHALGFAILHQAKDGEYLLLSRWYGGNMLKHAAFMIKRSPDGQASLEPLAATGIICCVWELELMKRERDFWLQTMMQPAPDSSSKSCDHSRQLYLSLHWEGWV
jgi:hypothetical protein